MDYQQELRKDLHNTFTRYPKSFRDITRDTGIAYNTAYKFLVKKENVSRTVCYKFERYLLELEDEHDRKKGIK